MQEVAEDEAMLQQALGGLQAALQGDLKTLSVFREVRPSAIVPHVSSTHPGSDTPTRCLYCIGEYARRPTDMLGEACKEENYITHI